MMRRICKKCEKAFKPVYRKPENYCDKCNDELWAEWEIEHADELTSIDELKTKGHSRHCACRIIWGDGECTCSMEKIA